MNSLDRSVDIGPYDDGFYYFDIETVPLPHYSAESNAGLDPSMSKIISIQYQHLSPSTGKPLERLKILREWESGSSERSIIMEFKKLFIDKGRNYFIPVGNNLRFENMFMKFKLRQFCNLHGLQLGNRMMVDLKPILVLMNGCTFTNYSAIIGKSNKAKEMATWYLDKQYDIIEQYIIEEAENFVSFYIYLVSQFPNLKRGYPGILSMKKPVVN
jgi:hypothetical protein